MKHLGRHQLFPQVFRFVEEYAETRIDWNGSKHGELALDVYSKKVVGWLADAIEPDDTQGETPLMPVIDRFQSQGSTHDVLFNTTRACHPTLKSHINQVVLDTDTWERSAAFQLEASPSVVFYARNDHLGFEIPYEHLCVAHIYSPDFIVRLMDGSTLILETKGMMRDPENSKMEAAKRWVKAVNNWGRMGRWVFHVCKNIDTLKAELEVLG
jgi:type III restriction enzyme